MGGSDVDFPEPTQEERELQQEQVNILRAQQQIIAEQARQQELLSPFIFESAGIRPVLDDEGSIVDFERLEPTEEETLLQDLQLDALRQLTEPEPEDPLAAQRQEIEAALLDRSQQALAGELPIPVGVEQELDEQERQLRLQLRDQLGPGFETSTPGIQALQRFRDSSQLIRDEARRGEITLAETLGLARGAANLQQRGFQLGTGEQRLANILNVGQAGRVASAANQAQLLGGQAGALNPALSLSSALGQTAAGFNQPLNRFLTSRQNQFRVNQFNAQQGNPAFQLLGTLTGTGLGAFTGAAGSQFGRSLFGRPTTG